jgi:hypothetical protein
VRHLPKNTAFGRELSNSGEPVTGVSTLSAEQAEVLNALAVKKPTAPQQLTLL